MQLELPFDVGSPERERELRERVRERTEELLARARERWPDVDFPPIENRFRLRGHCAGEACATNGIANYNLELLTRHGEDFLRRIVPHEVAHVVVGRVYGRSVKPHGTEWHSVMRFFGAQPTVTHDYQTTPARRVRRVRYRCRCSDGHLLTIRTHRRIRRGWVEYRCRTCQEPLVYVG